MYPLLIFVFGFGPLVLGVGMLIWAAAAVKHLRAVLVGALVVAIPLCYFTVAVLRQNGMPDGYSFICLLSFAAAVAAVGTAAWRNLHARVQRPSGSDA